MSAAAPPSAPVRCAGCGGWRRRGGQDHRILLRTGRQERLRRRGRRIRRHTSRSSRACPTRASSSPPRHESQCRRHRPPVPAARADWTLPAAAWARRDVNPHRQQQQQQQRLFVIRRTRRRSHGLAWTARKHDLITYTLEGQARCSTQQQRRGGRVTRRTGWRRACWACWRAHAASMRGASASSWACLPARGKNALLEMGLATHWPLLCSHRP